MKKIDKTIIISVIILTFLIIIFLTREKDIFAKEACFSQKCISVEIADTEEKRTRGLMYRESLNEDEGMLFIFEQEGVHLFWMKNTLIPLDIIWMDKELKIVDIQQAVPCTSEPRPVYYPKANAKYVVEVYAGFVEEKEIEIGDGVEIRKI